MDNKYNVFLRLLKLNSNKNDNQKVFKDFITVFAIKLSNKVFFNKSNDELCREITKEYSEEEKILFYSLAAELTRLFYKENSPYDILGDIYKKISEKDYLQLYNNNSSKLQEVGRKLQGIININRKTNNGRMLEVNCGSGAMILAYASTLKMFNLDYKKDLEVTAIDTDMFNVFMTYIQLYFYEISAIVIWVDKNSNKELMRLYTPTYENQYENLMVA